MKNLVFIDYNWENYNDLKYNNTKKIDQIKHLFYTGLCEGKDGAEYTFIPTKKMRNIEKEIEKIYSKIQIEDHEIELCDEIYYTTKIEGSHTTKKRTWELHNGEPVDHNDYFSEMMVLDGFKATKYLNLNGNKISHQILRQTWDLLTDGCCDNEDIKGNLYRSGNVQVGKHVGLNPILLEDAMENWINFYNGKILDEHPFIKASLLHVSFEMIHPFCDGNGRMGRLLMINYLISRGYDKCKAISFSRNISDNAIGYYLALEQSDNSYFDCSAFIEYMINSFKNTFYEVYERYKHDKAYNAISKFLTNEEEFTKDEIEDFILLCPELSEEEIDQIKSKIDYGYDT